jgi:tetratricopeptide (TPR) repeat protein
MIKKVFSVLLVGLVISCASKEEKAFKTFNEGVSLSLDAADMANEQNFEGAEEYNLKAIEKFHETLEIDPNHEGAPSALGHSYYLLKSFKEGITWHKKALEIDSTLAVNHLEYGLCLVNVGQVELGKEAIDKALELDNGKETLAQAVYSLLDIGLLAFEYGEQYTEQGEFQKGTDYQGFALAVLLTANKIDSTNQEIRKALVNFTASMGDSVASKAFEQKLE